MRDSRLSEGLRWLEQAEADRHGALDANYIPTRYPNGLPDNIPARVYGRPEAERALGMCDQLLDMVRSRLTRQ